MPSLPDHTTKVQQLFVQHAAQLKYFVISLLPNPGAAEDVVQEVFLTITAKAHDFEEGTNFKAWAFAIARYKALEQIRKEQRAPFHLSEETMELLAAEASEPDFSAGDDDHRLSQALAKCLKKLAPKPRLLIERVYRDGVKPGVVADEVGWKANATYVALSRARASLRLCIEKQGAGSI